MVGIVRIDAARTRSSGGKARNSMAMPTGASIPPPAPWRTLKATSWLRLVARPQSAEAPVKMTIALSSTRLPPKRSPSHPDAGMKMDKLTR